MLAAVLLNLVLIQLSVHVVLCLNRSLGTVSAATTVLQGATRLKGRSYLS